ncbi:unnamed protein product [Macrosiphum euphorbiae]|uniref:Uncharacterized protein n=1 Tax=Macrosiphum euphorbiae TaxID=13131 RepID=A0AAV0XZ53_9HEMI|nr:unnamed protein product [Macrosiphum euphorbiae]
MNVSSFILTSEGQGPDPQVSITVIAYLTLLNSPWFHCPRWDSVKLEIHTRLCRSLNTADLPENYFLGRSLDDLPIDEVQKATALN